MNFRLLNTVAALTLLTLLVFILHTARGLLVPLIIALVIWYIIIQFTSFFQKIKIGQFQLHYGFALFISIIIAVIIFYLFIMGLTYSISNIIHEAPQYQQKIQAIIQYINKITHDKFDLAEAIGSTNISQVFSHIAVIVSDLLSNTTLIFIYLLFLILEHKTFSQKLIGICGSEKQYKKLNTIIDRIHNDINTFMKIKTSINALAGVISYIALLFFHIEYAEFWGILIFLLHYIPFIGPVVAVFLVMIAASIQITSIALSCVLGVTLIMIQFFIGNFIEPKYMGSHLNLSPIVILLSLAFWGYVWGIIGMFLCVPLMVILGIIFAHFPRTKGIAVALSANGKII